MPTSLPGPEEGESIFSIVSALEALDPDHHELEYWDVSSLLAGPVSQSYFYHPGDSQR